MEIRYLGHACFQLKTKSGKTYLTDPYGGIGYELPPQKADVVTVSHGHFDHCDLSAVQGKYALVGNTGDYPELGVCGILSYHDEVKGKKRGQNIIFKFELDGVTVCHLGDLGEPYCEERVKEIGKVDVLLIPVGGNYTIDGKEAKWYEDKIKPSFVIPMHYKTPDLTIDIATPDEFLNLFPSFERNETGERTIEKEDLETNQTTVILMERYGK